MTLQINGALVSQAPTPKLIHDSLSKLDVDRDGEGFIILGQDQMTYLQVSGDSKRGFDAEYQQGAADKHYRADRGSFTLEEVATMLSEYLEGEISWEKYGTWSKITW